MAMKCFWTQKKQLSIGEAVVSCWHFDLSWEMAQRAIVKNAEGQIRNPDLLYFLLLARASLCALSTNSAINLLQLAVEVLQVYGESSSSLSLLICTSQPPSLCYRLTEGPQGPYISSTHTHLLSPSEPIKRLLRE